MATVFPKKRLQDNEILDIDDTNNAFRDMSQEAGSALGEHNWKKGAFGAAHLGPTEVIIATSAYQESDHSSAFESGPAPAGSYVTGAAHSWEVVEGLTVTITTGNSLVWIMASLQYTNAMSLEANDQEACFCLAHNGAFLPETITGTADKTNDPECKGILAVRSPVVLDTLLPVSPGSHTFTVLCRTAQNFDWGNWLPPLYDDTVDNRELIVLEIK